MIRIPVSLLTSKEWAAIEDPTLTSSEMVTKAYVDGDYPNQGIHFHPIPGAAIQVEIRYWGALTQFDSPSEQLSAPSGFYDALVYELATQLSLIYKGQPRPEIEALAANAKKSMQELNAQILSGSFNNERTLTDANMGEISPLGGDG